VPTDVQYLPVAQGDTAEVVVVHAQAKAKMYVPALARLARLQAWHTTTVPHPHAQSVHYNQMPKSHATSMHRQSHTIMRTNQKSTKHRANAA
jgi:hypothetical protein